MGVHRGPNRDIILVFLKCKFSWAMVVTYLENGVRTYGAGVFAAPSMYQLSVSYVLH